jgi:hypothetical protein
LFLYISINVNFWNNRPARPEPLCGHNGKRLSVTCLACQSSAGAILVAGLSEFVVKHWCNEARHQNLMASHNLAASISRISSVR